MSAMLEAPVAGQIVRVRQRQYLVEEVVPPGAGDDACLVRMSCLDDDAQGQPLEVLWEKEVDSERITAESWQEIASRGFDPPKLFSAYLHTLQWNCVTATDPNLFQSPFRAGIRIDAYQLEPLQKALRLPRVNLFIADDVGLGKTIEAGLIARELLLRKKVQDIVVACPPFFHDTGTMDDDVVHLHLEHRVVQRLFGRFTAQGFVHHDLSRACLSQTTDAIPRVILMGRFCLYGPRAARLHEELVPVTARWIELSLRKHALSPYGREAELKTLDLLESALLPTSVPDVDLVIQAKLREAAARDIAELLPHLEIRGRELAEGVRMGLAKRADQEATAMRTILEEQKTRVADTAAKYRDPQIRLDFNDDEQRQLESNKRHWEKRLNAITPLTASGPPSPSASGRYTKSRPSGSSRWG